MVTFVTSTKTLLIHFAEKFRAAPWTIPAFYVVLAIALSQFTLWLDASGHFSNPATTGFFHISSPEGARVLLGTIATSMLAIAGVSFSSTMVTMTLASQQFGPRLLRNFLKDRASQRTLGVLLGTFVFCLFILREVRSIENDWFVPALSVMTSVVLAMIGLGCFIHFIQHILREIQAEQVVADAFRGLQSSIEAVFPEIGEELVEDRAILQMAADWEIEGYKTGYVQAINYEAMVEIAMEQKVRLKIHCRAGDFVSDQQVVASVDNVEAEKPDRDLIIEKTRESFYIGSARTPEQDFEYGFRQLVEVALRALSPGINDPFTAMDCIDYLGAGLQSTFARPLPQPVHRDREGAIRVVACGTDYAGLVGAAFNQIRQASRERCDVSCRLLETLALTARVARQSEQRAALLKQAQMIRDDSSPKMSNDFDRDCLESRYQSVEAVCSRSKKTVP